MSNSLAEVQQEFTRALKYESDGERCDIVSDHFSDTQRIQIYRNNFIISLSEVMSATYPMVEALVGEECFTQLARQYVLSTPLHSADVSEYGEGFSETIQLFPSVVEAAPYLSEVARFEWCCDQTFRSAQCELTLKTIQPLAELVHVSPEQHHSLLLHLKDGVSLFDSPYALYSLQQAILDDNIEQLNIQQSETGVITLANTQHTNDEQIVCHSLTNEAYQLVIAINDGNSLSEIEPHLLPHLDSIISLGIVAGFSVSAPKEKIYE